MKKLWKITAAVTALLILMLCLGISSATAADESTVRVKLSVSSSSVKINVRGNYHIDGGANLSTGSYTVSVSGSNVRIKGGSIDQTVSGTLTLVRDETAVNERNIVVSGAPAGSNGYLGDMSFYVSSGKIVVVNTLPVEQYLYGVVAYEMSNSFPLEALKAQAVCARGYVMKSLSSSGNYDIGDTSSDQVYRGYEPDYTNVIKAVDGTKGQVLMYDGDIISTYYSASNGGQTELPGNAWGGGSSKNKEYPYLAQKDDPYDLENESSLEQVIFVPKDVKNSDDAAVETDGGDYIRIVNVNEYCNVRSGPGTSYDLVGHANLNELYPMLGKTGEWFKITYNGKTAYVIDDYATQVESGRFVYSNSVLDDLQTQAYTALKSKVAESTDIEIISVNSMSNGKERWPDTGSRSYVTANANITVQYYAKGSSSKSDAAKLDVTITLMEGSEGSYVLAHDYLNSNLRLRSVESASGGFNVVARRYGHGVGMSQRGAQTMAADYGMSYEEILAFYFEGTTLSNASSGGGSSGGSATISSSKHTLSGSTITKLSENLSVSTFLKNFTVKNGSIKLYTASGSAKTSGTVATGDVLRLLNSSGSVQKSYTLVLYGDVSGDGKISMVDLLSVHRNLSNLSSLSGAYKTAADINRDGSLSMADMLAIHRHLSALASITQ